jgi:hypothetical protein
MYAIVYHFVFETWKLTLHDVACSVYNRAYSMKVGMV